MKAVLLILLILLTPTVVNATSTQTVRIDGVSWVWLHGTVQSSRLTVWLPGGLLLTLTWAKTTIHYGVTVAFTDPATLNRYLPLTDILTLQQNVTFPLDSQGDFSFLTNAVTWAHNQGYREVNLFGHSAGALILLRIMTEIQASNVSTVILSGCPCNFTQRQYWFEALKSVNQRMLFITGTRDGSFNETVNVYRILKGNGVNVALLILFGWNHGDLSTPPL